MSMKNYVERLTEIANALTDETVKEDILIVLDAIDISNTIYMSWNVEDVLVRAEDRDIELTEDEARKILHQLDEKHDASIGINWDTIDCITDMFLQEKE